MEHTCDGADTAPDVTWSSPPEGTRSLVITLDDVEGSEESATRWVVFDIRPEARSLRAGADPATLGAKLGRTDGKTNGYHGPCPPRHLGHHYSLHVIALDRALGLDDAASREAVNAAMNGHVLASGELVGTVVR
jgi:Raf kinase inhibitor-like YbhB/YbcL family protein